MSLSYESIDRNNHSAAGTDNEDEADERSKLIVPNPTIQVPDQQQTSINRSITNSRSNNPGGSSLFVNDVQISVSNPEHNPLLNLRKLWKFTGPGLLISVAYLDPGNLDVDLQSGAIAGYKLLWVLMYSTLAGYLLQMLSVRLGSVTGFHLAEICYREYGRFTRIFLWLMIEISIIASDIQQVLGSALALTILSNGGISLWVAILITACDVFLFLLLENTGIRIFEAMFAILIALMGASFLYMYIVAQPDQFEVVKGVIVPWCQNCTGQELNQLIGIVGSIVMPHNLFFHSCLVLSRNFNRKSEEAVKEANKYYGIESAFALFVSFLLNLFVTTVSAKSFNNSPESANVTLFNAATFINSEYGVSMKVIWAIGLLASGQCSTISGTYAGQFIMQGLTKINLTKWRRIIVTRSISIVPCVIVCLLFTDSIIHVNLWCNIIKALQLPFALLPILHFTRSRRIMGAFRNNLFFQLVCYTITFGVLAINIYFLISFIVETNKLWSYMVGSALVLYLFFVIFFEKEIIYQKCITFRTDISTQLLGVNNIYRIKLFFRKIFCAYNAEELDELLHSNPVYRRPERRQLQVPPPLIGLDPNNSAFLASTSYSPNLLNPSPHHSQLRVGVGSSINPSGQDLLHASMRPSPLATQSNTGGTLLNSNNSGRMNFNNVFT